MAKRKPSKLEKMLFKEHYKITFRVIGITLGILLMFGGGGYLLDKQLGTYPYIFIGGLLVAFPLTQIAIFYTFKNIADPNSK